MNKDQNEIASGKPREAQAVDRIQEPIVGPKDTIESRAYEIAKMFKGGVSGLIVIGDNARVFDIAFTGEITSKALVDGFSNIASSLSRELGIADGSNERNNRGA